MQQHRLPFRSSGINTKYVFKLKLNQKMKKLIIALAVSTVFVACSDSSTSSTETSTDSTTVSTDTSSMMSTPPADTTSAMATDTTKMTDTSTKK